MANVQIRVLLMSDWEIYRRLRLLALQDSPDSFGSTYEREAEFTDEEWISRLNASNRAKHALPLIAELDGVAVGLAWGQIHSSSSIPMNTDAAHVYQMWMSPRARGYGLSKLLLNSIIDWAKKSNRKVVCLEVTIVNEAAVNLYKSIGFVAAGETQTLREGSALLTQTMILELCG
jgi:GNAT superfamily N-acetyltransferase